MCVLVFGFAGVVLHVGRWVVLVVFLLWVVLFGVGCLPALCGFCGLLQYSSFVLVLRVSWFLGWFVFGGLVGLVLVGVVLFWFGLVWFDCRLVGVFG